MLRTFARLAAVTVTALTLVVVAVPTADARPVAVRAHSSVEQSWFAATWSWLGTLMPAIASPTAGLTQKSAESTQIPPPNGQTGGSHTLTGPCVDPTGRFVPCNQ